MALMLAGLVAAFACGFWIPQQMRESRLRRIIAGVAESTGVESIDLRRLPPLMQEVASLTRELEAQTRFVPEDAQLAELLKSISTELGARDLRDAETQTQPIVAGARYSVLPVTLQFKGAFPAAYHLLSTLESSRRLVWVTRLEMIREKDSGADVSVLMELNTFFSPAEESHP